MFQLKLSPEQENELNNQHYLLIYLILLILDQWVATQEMEASATYFEHVHPKYRRFSPKGPNQLSPTKKDNSGTLRHLQCLMDLCTQCHLSIEDLLVWKPTPGMYSQVGTVSIGCHRRLLIIFFFYENHSVLYRNRRQRRQL